MRLIEWVEPWDGQGDINLICRMTESDAIKAQRRLAAARKPDFKYKSDAEALDDFMTVHWAKRVEKIGPVDVTIDENAEASVCGCGGQISKDNDGDWICDSCPYWKRLGE